MPPTHRKKRKADDSSTTPTPKAKKTKAEKDYDKASARWTMQGGNPDDFDEERAKWILDGKLPKDFPGGTAPRPPTKRRKTSDNNNSTTTTTSSASSKKKPASSTNGKTPNNPFFAMGSSPPAAASAASPAKKRSTPRAAAAAVTSPAAASAASPASSKKMSKREEQKARAAQWAAEQRAQKSGASPTNNDNDNSSSTKKPAATASYRRGAAYRRTSTEKNEAENTIPKPPTSFTTPVLQQPAAAAAKTNHDSPDVFHSPEPPRVTMDVGVKSPAQRERENLAKKAATDGGKIQMLFRKLFLVAVVPLLMGFFLFNVVGRYNPKTGVWTIPGKTTYPCSDHTVLWGKSCWTNESEPYVVNDEDPVDLAALQHQHCYEDSPEHVLQMLGVDTKTSAPGVDPSHCPNGFQACPNNAICYKGTMLGCQAPVWVLLEPENDEEIMTCVLSPFVNDTYAKVVTAVEEWSQHHLCLQHTDVPSPLSFYMQSDDSDPFTAVLVVEADSSLTAPQGIPLYPWDTIYSIINDDVHQDLKGHWDWNLLQIANDAHKKQLVLVGESIGLAPQLYDLVERTKLPFACKTARGMLRAMDWVQNLCGYILISLWRMMWFCLTTYPKFTISVLLVTGFLFWLRQRTLKKKRQRKRVYEIRQLVYERLKAALKKSPGTGMRPGEVAVMHLRDGLVFDLHGYGTDKDRREFHELWPMVCLEIKRDNRVLKAHRLVGGTKRDLWMWAAGEDDSSQ